MVIFLYIVALCNSKKVHMASSYKIRFNLLFLVILFFLLFSN